jgi:hypothetical protein
MSLATTAQPAAPGTSPAVERFDDTATDTDDDSPNDRRHSNRLASPTERFRPEQWASITNIHKELLQSTDSAKQRELEPEPGDDHNDNANTVDQKDFQDKKTASKSVPSRKSKKKKPKRDPTKPKRPMNAFLLFVRAESKAVKENYPGLSHKDALSIMGEAWRNADQADKLPYMQQKDQAQQRYQVDLRVWRESQRTQASNTTNTNTTNNDKEPRLLHPKAPPLKKQDGTYSRPRGPAPGGLFWDAIRGCWGSTQRKHPPTAQSAAQSQSRSSPRQLTAAVSSRDFARDSVGTPKPVFKNAVVARRKDNGTFVRPRGATPTGCSWDTNRGLWVRVGPGVLSLSRSVTLPHNKSNNNSNNNKYSESQNATTSKPFKPNGTYPRPRGRSRMWKAWDANKGIWMPDSQVQSSNKQNRERVATVTESRSPEKRRGSWLDAATDYKDDEDGDDSIVASASRSTKVVPVDPFDALNAPARAFLLRQGITTQEQLFGHESDELAAAFTQWRHEENMPQLKHEHSAKSNIVVWKSLVKKASSGSPKKKRKRESKANTDAPLNAQPKDGAHIEWPHPNKKPHLTRMACKLTHVACGTCQGCRNGRDCGRCLPCKLLLDTVAGVMVHTCVRRICTSPVSRRAERPALSAPGKRVDVATTSSRSRLDKRKASTHTTYRPPESVVESLSDHNSLVGDDMSDLESPALVAAETAKQLSRENGGAFMKYRVDSDDSDSSSDSSSDSNSSSDDYPGLSHKDTLSIMGEAWRNADQADKLPYMQQKDQAQQRYQEELRVWRES